MSKESGDQFDDVIRESLRRLVDDPLTRDRAVTAIGQVVDERTAAQWVKMKVLARLHWEQVAPVVDQMAKEGHRFEDLSSDSAEAHRRAADIQRILRAFGLELGPDGVDGYIGGPPGKPAVLGLDECARLIADGSPRTKLLEDKAGAAESWTRDATRRLQFFLGQFGIPDDRADLRAGCLVSPDGLFGSRTLAGVQAFLAAPGPPKNMA
jgi:hypothetical protein